VSQYGIGQPNAEAAEDSQKAQKKIMKKIWLFALRPLRDLCALCVRLSAFRIA